MEIFRKILICLWILQTRKVSKRLVVNNKWLRDRGRSKFDFDYIEYKLNPWNPLTYIAIILLFFLPLFLFILLQSSLEEIVNNLPEDNVFKWDKLTKHI